MLRAGPTEHILTASTNRGKFALDDPEMGEDITAGCRLEIWLAGQWISGTVRHMVECYPGQSQVGLFEPAEGPAIHGYYFEANGGGICGLCVGQRVRLL
jgi:hypothetical protein